VRVEHDMARGTQEQNVVRAFRPFSNDVGFLSDSNVMAAHFANAFSFHVILLRGHRTVFGKVVCSSSRLDAVLGANVCPALGFLVWCREVFGKNSKFVRQFYQVSTGPFGTGIC